MTSRPTWKSFLALLFVVFIPFGIMIWLRSGESSGFADLELIIYPLTFGTAGIILVYLVKRYWLKESVLEFNSGRGNRYSDLGWGLALTVVYFLVFFGSRQTLARWLPFNPNQEMLGLMLDLRKDPLLLLLWFGPVLWIGIALFEEVIRVFALSTMWKWSASPGWALAVILLIAILMGLVHWSQGAYGIVTIGIKGLIAGYFFYRKRRLMPLVYAHVLYDGLQVAMFVLTYPEE